MNKQQVMNFLVKLGVSYQSGSCNDCQLVKHLIGLLKAFKKKGKIEF